MIVVYFQSVVCHLAVSSSLWFPVGGFRRLLGMLKGEAEHPPESGLPYAFGRGTEWQAEGP